MKFTRGDRIEVVWDDHNSNHGWKCDKFVEPKLELIHSLGYFVKQTPTVIVLAQSLDNDSTSEMATADRLTVGKRLIRRIRRVKYAHA